jgi:hypothetical protein
MDYTDPEGPAHPLMLLASMLEGEREGRELVEINSLL